MKVKFSIQTFILVIYIMENATKVTTDNCLNYEICSFVMIILFLVSEILPFIKKTRGAGILHTSLYILKKSSVLTKQMTHQIDKLEKQLNSR